MVYGEGGEWMYGGEGRGGEGKTYRSFLGSREHEGSIAVAHLSLLQTAELSREIILRSSSNVSATT